MRHIEATDISLEDQVILVAEFRRVRDPEVRNQIISSMVRLVTDIINKDFDCKPSVFQDVFHEGILGVVDAIEKFNPEMSGNFPNYAAWWIRMRVRRFLAKNSKQFTLTTHISSVSSAMKKQRRIFFSENSREPSYRELAQKLGKTEKHLRLCENSGGKQISLDGHWKWGDTNAHSALEGEMITKNEPCDRLDEERDGVLNSAISGLTETEQTVLVRRFGLDGRGEKTLREVGGELGCSCEWVRKIQDKAMGKLAKRIKKEDVI